MGEYAIVTNTNRGVYFGKLSDYTLGDTTVTIEEAKICFMWKANEGIGELAKTGPKPGSKLGPELPKMIINNVANVIFVTAVAVKRWKEQGWD